MPESPITHSENRCKGTLAHGSDRLADCLELGDRLRAETGKLQVYATMAYNVDSHDRAAQVRVERLRTLGGRVAQGTAFLQPELLDIGVDTLRDWIRSEARLSHYHHFTVRLERAARHTRSEEVEELLGALTAPFGSATQAHGVLANTDLDFGSATDEDGAEHDITQGTIGTLLASRDPALRRDAYRRYGDAHRGVRTTMAALMGTGVRQNLMLARARRYESALHAAMEPQGLPIEVFHNLIATFRSKLPVWHRYWRAKRLMLGQDSFHPSDVQAPLVDDPPVVPYDQAVDWLCSALEPLGADYIEALRRGALQDGWVDRYPNRGKRMGAFSTGVQGTHPFIMMSYSDDVSGMSTLAHELGHSMHSYLSWRSQPRAYSGYSLFAAEVASNFNQAMLRAHLRERFEGDRRMQLSIIEEAMANFYRYFFVMPTLARFEFEIHERTARGEALSADLLDGLMADLFAEGFGDEVAMDRERVGITWAQFHTHLYSRFYVYQYATGISGAHALARGILDGRPDATERYLDFLRAGGSKDPLEALLDAGVDLRSPTPVEETFDVLERLVERLEGLVP